jgi:hypothetical protein
MTDPFTDVADELMTRSTDLGGSEAAPPQPPSGAKTKKHVCPYCGAVTAVVEKPTGPCPRCNMEDTPATRAATKARIGPWYVLQTRNPSAPGMKWATLLSLVSKGQVTPRSVVRGPTTHQLWKFAAHVKGLSREFNLCYSCGGEIERTANQCPHCDRLQEPPVNPDSLLETRELGPRAPIQREIKPPIPAPAPTDLVLAGRQEDALARPRSPDDGILSAKELAAAFQLDFNPAAPTSIEPTEPRARRRPLRVLAAVMLLAIIAGGGVLLARPDYRDKSVAWFNSTFASIRNSINPPKPAPKSMPWDDSQTAQQKPEDTTSTPAAVKQEPAPETSQSPAPTSPTTPEVTAQNQTAAPAPQPTPPPVQVAEAPKPAPDPAVAAPAPAPQPVQVAEKTPAAPVSKEQQKQEKIKADLDSSVSASSDLPEQEKLSRQLWLDGLDAQRLGDFPLAIQCYDRLKKLDAKVRQSDNVINIEIEFCKKELP